MGWSLAVFSRFCWCLMLFGFGLLWVAGKPVANAQKSPAGAQTPDQYAVVPLDGAKIYRNYCAACHGIGGGGDGPAAAALKTPLPDLTTIARRNQGTFPAAHVRSIIAGDNVPAAHGSRAMPIWGPMFHAIDNDRDMGYVRLQNTSDYLKSLQE